MLNLAIKLPNSTHNAALDLLSLFLIPAISAFVRLLQFFVCPFFLEIFDSDFLAGVLFCTLIFCHGLLIFLLIFDKVLFFNGKIRLFLIYFPEFQLTNNPQMGYRVD